MTHQGHSGQDIAMADSYSAVNQEQRAVQMGNIG
jgi:hypothetical protein